MTEKRLAAWVGGVCKTCGAYTHSCKCEHPSASLLDGIFVQSTTEPNAAPQAGQSSKAAPSHEGHAAGPAVAAPVPMPRVQQCGICLDSPPYEKCTGIISSENDAACTRLTQAERELAGLRALLTGWAGYAWHNGEYIDDIQEFFDAALKGTP